MTDRASFDRLFRPEILVGVSGQTNAVPENARPDVHLYNRIAANSSLFPSMLAAKTDGGSHGVGFLRLFPRLCAGQDALSENSNQFKSISVVIPIAFADFSRRFCVCFRSIRAFVHHESNRIGEFLSWVTNVLSRTTK
ncbi:hypothetical protein [Phyllobacterium brassicacearum]|uniref:hypothetical protein n=1 Tax=Phyllobacterium brassicacearum TaxID=314235 RepID=UPI00105EB688|nr:hypothetical protein [Phyllobacterium brassicacearum]TDQ19924.1 hypothetical protein DEV91_124119 [Phyllobacterium brassicacearum]